MKLDYLGTPETSLPEGWPACDHFDGNDDRALAKIETGLYAAGSKKDGYELVTRGGDLAWPGGASIVPAASAPAKPSKTKKADAEIPGEG